MEGLLKWLLMVSICLGVFLIFVACPPLGILLAIFVWLVLRNR